MTAERIQSSSGAIGLVLTGGGARGAYQAGVLKAIAEIRSETPGARPISVITGVSAGAINAAFLACSPLPELDAAIDLTRLWRTLESRYIFRTDAATLGRIGASWFTDATLGALYKRKLARALLDTSPLRELLTKNINFKELPRKIAEGRVDALSITALNYANAHNVAWVQAKDGAPSWVRARRRSENVAINVDHVMASAAIPLFFPPIRVGDSFFGDGCLRNTAPLSPALHLGAERLIVISVRRPDHRAPQTEVGIEPSLARILGVMINALLMDSIEFDMERLNRINSTLNYIPGKTRDELDLNKIEALWIRPSADIGKIAETQFDSLPSVLRYLLSGLGTPRESAELTSYLLFDPDYCGQLLDLGYQDGRAMTADIKALLAP